DEALRVRRARRRARQSCRGSRQSRQGCIRRRRPEHGYHAVSRMTADPPSLPDEWRVEIARRIADTIAGTVYDVTRAGGERDIVKVLKPKALEDSLRGADFLAWRGGIGCVRLIARSGNILLMEHAGTVTLKDRIASHGDRDAAMIAAAVLTEYHGASDRRPPASLQPLDRYFESLFRK